jgi:DNA modification methylase
MIKRLLTHEERSAILKQAWAKRKGAPKPQANPRGRYPEFPIPPQRQSLECSVTLYRGDCMDVLESFVNEGRQYDAIITDPPFEIGIQAYDWDKTGITFSPDLWSLLYRVIKPGGFLAAFAAPRLYHRLATAAEDAGFLVYPFLSWAYDRGLPKPINVSEMFDRDNVSEREIIGYRNGSGFTTGNVSHGLQNRSSNQFAIHARHVSDEARQWRGWYYGLNCMRPGIIPILLVQKPIHAKRTIDNLRAYGTGALNLGHLKQRYGKWPSTVLEHAVGHKIDHASGHPSVKPVSLMIDLCQLLCPPNGDILDPFAGTGSTGVAAKRCGFNCTLIENNEKMEEVIRRRVDHE